MSFLVDVYDLNADRDMYQAYVAMRDILSLDENSEEYDELLENYELQHHKLCL